ncbi:MAG TPA: phosphatase PAP2 family protein [Gaiellaceae bacterium]|nr:phosphatase PAP2 family protein [Gaiellaceae bacterium]
MPATRYARVLGVSTALFTALVATVLLWDDVDRIDVRFVSWVHRNAPDGVVEAMRVVSYAGSGLALGVVALTTAILLTRRQRSRAAALVVAASVGGLLATQALKAAVRRARPEFDEPYVQLTTYAFPSGHALGATATYGALAIVLATSVRAPRKRRALVGGLCALIVLIAASRVVLGVHYLLDVIAGMVGGIALLSALLLAYELAPHRGVRLRVRRDEQAQSPGSDV